MTSANLETIDQQTATKPTTGRSGAAKRLLIGALLAAALLLTLTTYWLLHEGTVSLQSSPSGAEVWLDGQMIGNTPLTLHTRLASQQGSLEFRLAGLEPQRADLRLEPRQSGEVAVTLLAKLGTVQVRSEPSGAQVYLDGALAGTSPAALVNVNGGTHQLRLTLDGYAAWTKEVTVKPEDNLTIEAALVGLTGGLEVSSTPSGAKVYLDSQARGNTPLTLGDITPGEHEVRVSTGGYDDWQQRVTVGPNSRTEVKATLVRRVTEITYQRAIAAMIDNHPDARPQSGLAQANVVYEALAEGGITRFMALFMSQAAAQVGPIRSARHYFVYWADEFNAMYAHCGGYTEAYQAIAATGTVDLDDLHGSPGFWRTDDRDAPHNLYTSTANQRAEADRRGLKQSAGSTAGLKFSDDPQPAGKNATSVTLHYPYNYNVGWRYVPESNDYLRFTAGAPHVDQATGKQLRGSNVIVLFMRNWFLGGDDQQDFQVTGSGRALYFRDGKVMEGTWSRTSLNQTTNYFDGDGKAVLLEKGGTTWIQVVPVDAAVNVE